MSEVIKTRATPKDVLIWVGVRRVLTTLANMASRLEEDEFIRLRSQLLGELEALTPGGPHAEIWCQSVESMLDTMAQAGAGETSQGMSAYGLERIGLLPKPE